VQYENRGATALAAENQSQHDRQTSAIAEYRARWRALDVSLSVRYDANQLFKDAATYRITLASPLGATRRLHSSLGTGIANPGFFELFGYFPESFTGNPALVPEKSLSFDVGIEQRFAAGRVRLDATYFHSDLENELETVFDPVDFLATVVNLPATSERRGLELALNAMLGARWVLAASWTYTDADQADGARELRRPRQMGSIASTLTFAQTRGRLHMGLDYNGRQDDSEFILATPEDRVTLDAFTLLRVAADYEIAPQWRLYGRVENLLDERYEEWFSYRSPGRTMAVGFEHALAR
jgi:vitamin B12 transporter